MLVPQLLLGSSVALLAASLALASPPKLPATTKPHKARSHSSPIMGSDTFSTIGCIHINNTEMSNPGVSCFMQPARPPHIPPIATVNDCYAAVTQILYDPWSLVPEIWSSTRGRFRLPYQWGYVSCMIAIDVGRPGTEESFSLALVAQTAAAIVRVCLVENRHMLGGTAKVGPQQVMDIMVAHSGVYKTLDDNPGSSS